MGTEGRFRSSAGTIASIKLSMASMKLSSAGSVHWLVAELLRSNPEIGPTISDRCARSSRVSPSAAVSAAVLVAYLQTG